MEVKIQFLLPCQETSLSQGFEGLEEEHCSEIGAQGSVGQQQPRGISAMSMDLKRS